MDVVKNVRIADIASDNEFRESKAVELDALRLHFQVKLRELNRTSSGYSNFMIDHLRDLYRSMTGEELEEEESA